MTRISQLVGFNDNLHYQGGTFHVQTEDSGASHAHVITHLFNASGCILKTLKGSYTDHVRESDLDATVRAMMVRQHKAMCAALLRGRFDALLIAPPPESMPRATRRATPKVSDLEELIACGELVQERSLDEVLLTYMALGLGTAA